MRNKVYVDQVSGAAAAADTYSALTSGAVQRQHQIDSALVFMRLRTKQEAWHCQYYSHAPVHKIVLWGQAKKHGVLEF